MYQDRAPLISGEVYDSHSGRPAASTWIDYYATVRGGREALAVAQRWVNDLQQRLPALTDYQSVSVRPSRFGANLNFVLQGLRGGDRDLEAREALTNLCLETADRAGARLRGLSFLGWETSVRPFDHGAHLQRARARRADLRFVQRFERLLDHDAAIGSARHPELVRSLHLEFSPEAEILVRSAVGGFIGQQIQADELLDPGILPPILEPLLATGWLEYPPHALVTAEPFVVAPGPLARQLTGRDLVRFH
jgi:hypothetical protein